MKIAIYAGMFKRNQDGATKTLYELAGSLIKQDFEVGIWSFAISPMDIEGISLFKVRSIPLPIYPDYRIAFPTNKLKSQLEEFNPDLVHVTVPDIVGTAFIKYAKEKKIPVITSFHTDFPSYLKSYKLDLFYNLSWKYLKWFYNRSMSVYAPTNAIASKLSDKGIRNVKLWTRGIYSEKYNPAFRSKTLRNEWGADGKFVILYSGRFVWYKDLETFARVYLLFRQKGPENVLFVLAGDGPIRKELERRMPLAVFTGYLHGEELSQVYASSDLFLFPSTTETFGNVVQEALASGLPAVVSDVGGCKEIVQLSKAGFVVKAGCPELFYESCRRLVEDRRLFRRLRLNGLKYARHQSWDRINGKLISEYRDYIDRSIMAGRLVRDRSYERRQLKSH